MSWVWSWVSDSLRRHASAFPRPRDDTNEQSRLLDDTTMLADLGYEAELPRRLSSLSMLGMAFAILNSWCVLSASLSLSLPSGGPVAVVWGLIATAICDLCLVTSLAEFLSAYPTAGGQYHWVAILSTERYAKHLAWVTGWISVFGWMAVAASGSLLTSQLLLGLIASIRKTYQPSGNEYFACYICVTVTAFAANCKFNGILPSLSKAAFLWSILGFVSIPTILLVMEPHYTEPSFIFGYFVNETGWPDGLAWTLGLLQAGLGLNGFDAVAHMIEEIPNASVEGPKIMVACLILGACTGFIFLTVLLLVSGGPQAIPSIIHSTAGPLLTILNSSTQSPFGAACLALFPLLSLLLGTVSIFTTSSRMVFAFARDGGLPGSKFFAKVHKTSSMPFNALCLTTAVTATFGCILLASSAAFNAISSASVSALSLSYAMPVAINCMRGRPRQLSGAFILPPVLGWVVNIVGIFHATTTSVLFLFPPRKPVDVGSMNYGSVALVLVLLGCLTAWIVHGQEKYEGPAMLKYNDLPTNDRCEHST